MMIDDMDWKIAAGYPGENEMDEESKKEFERFLDDTYAEWMHNRAVEEFGSIREDF